MADLNALIAQGYQTPAPPDPFAQYAKMQQLNVGQNQNALAQYQLAQAQRQDVQANALNAAYASGVNPDTGEMDYAKVRRYLAAGGAGSQIPALEKSRLEQEKAGFEQKKLLGEIAAQPGARAKTEAETNDYIAKTLDKTLENFNKINSPLAAASAGAQGVQNYITSLYDHPILGAVASKMKPFDVALKENLAAFQDDPRQWIAAHSQLNGQSILDTMKGTRQNTNLGGTSRGETIDVYGRVVPGSTVNTNIGISADTSARLAFDQQKFTWEKANPGHELIQNADGEYYAVDKRTRALTPLMIGGAAPAAAAPVAAAAPAASAVATPAGGVPVGRTAPAAGVPFVGKSANLTESQGNATAFGMRMKDSHDLLTKLENMGETNTGLTRGVVGGTLGLVPLIGDKLNDATGNVFNALPGVLGGLSENQQRVQNARINFITAILRKESGAAISPQEFTTAEKLYFPSPGEGTNVIKQKQRARDLAIKAMKVQAGPGAKSIDQLDVGGAGTPSANDPLGLR